MDLDETVNHVLTMYDLSPSKKAAEAGRTVARLRD
jgi:hypothetical protein